MREMEQEVASAASFINCAVGEDVSPYYWEVPANFMVPAVYYPAPEIESAGDALDTFEASYTWLIKFFHKTDAEAHDLARAALMAIKRARNVVPLIEVDGTAAGRGFRVRDPSIKQVDRCAWQLTLRWDSPRYFDRADSQQVEKFKFIVNGLGDIIPSKETMAYDATAQTNISRQEYEPVPAGIIAAGGLNTR